MASAEERRPLPPEPLECRQNADALLARSSGTFEALPIKAVAWALLAIAGELAVIRREMRKQR
jgi:hypothetical protein